MVIPLRLKLQFGREARDQFRLKLLKKLSPTVVIFVILKLSIGREASCQLLLKLVKK